MRCITVCNAASKTACREFESFCPRHQLKPDSSHNRADYRVSSFVSKRQWLYQFATFSNTFSNTCVFSGRKKRLYYAIYRHSHPVELRRISDMSMTLSDDGFGFVTDGTEIISDFFSPVVIACAILCLAFRLTT